MTELRHLRYLLDAGRRTSLRQVRRARGHGWATAGGFTWEEICKLGWIIVLVVFPIHPVTDDAAILTSD